MSVKRKSTLKAKVLTVLLIVLFVGSCATLIFAICTGQLNREDNTNPNSTQSVTETSTVDTTDATQLTTEATVEETTEASETTEVASSQITVGSTYNVDYWAEYKAENGSAGIGVLFGAHTQGVVISFEGNRFSVSTLSAYDTLDVATGTFSVVSDSEIELRYDNSAIETATVVESENGIATVIDFPMDIEDTTLRASLAQ